MYPCNPDNIRNYLLANAVLKRPTPQDEITKCGKIIRVKTSEVDFKLKPLRYRQVSLEVRMAPATALSSPEILNRILIATILSLAKKSGLQVESSRPKFKPKKKK